MPRLLSFKIFKVKLKVMKVMLNIIMFVYVIGGSILGGGGQGNLCRYREGQARTQITQPAAIPFLQLKQSE